VVINENAAIGNAVVRTKGDESKKFLRFERQ